MGCSGSKPQTTASVSIKNIYNSKKYMLVNLLFVGVLLNLWYSNEFAVLFG